MISRRSLLFVGAAIPVAAGTGPSGRAQCVTDTPAVGACRGGVRITAAPPSLSLDFMTPGTLDPRITFTRASVGTYFDVAGVLQTATANTPRWDYDPVTHALRGLLIEEARTNLAFPSNDMVGLFTSSVTAVTLTAASGVAPDGTNTMARIAETAVTSVHYCAKNLTVTANSTFTFSLFAATQQNRYVQIFFDDAVAGIHATFDLVAGTISGPVAIHGTGATALSASIQPVSSGYRLSITGTQTSATLLRFGVVMVNTPNPGFAVNYAGNAANGLLIWGAQVEVGAFATSYIPTTTASVTRAADLATMPVGPWFNATQGTLAADHMFPMTPAAGSFPSIALLSDGTLNNRILLLYAATGVRYRGVIYVGNIAVFDSSAGAAIAATVGATAKTAISWAAPTAQYAANGTIVLSGSTTVPTVTTLAFGHNGTGTTDSVRYIQRTRYWPRALSDTELQQATT